MQSRTFFRLLSAVCLWSAVSTAAQAQPLFFSDQLTYTGTWKEYTSNGQGLDPIATGTFNGGGLTVNFETPAGAGTGNIFGTAGNYFALTSPTVNSTQNRTFFDNNLTSATTQQSGSTSGTTGAFDPTGGVFNPAVSGDWLSFAFTATLNGLGGATAGGTEFVFDNTGGGTGPTSASGSFQGLFQNTGAGGNGHYYLVEFNVTGGVGTQSYIDGVAIPEPASCLAFAVVFAASAGYGWRRKRAVGTVAA